PAHELPASRLQDQGLPAAPLDRLPRAERRQPAVPQLRVARQLAALAGCRRAPACERDREDPRGEGRLRPPPAPPDVPAVGGRGDPRARGTGLRGDLPARLLRAALALPLPRPARTGQRPGPA